MGKLLHHTIEGSHIAFPWLEIPGCPSLCIVKSEVLSEEPRTHPAQGGAGLWER